VIQLFLPHKPQPCAKVRRALELLKFEKQPQKGTSHEHYEKVVNGHKYKVTVDCHNGEISAKNIKSIVAQAGISKLEFLKALKL
jgi:NACalpha-BTF3-like transcription factor